MLSRSVSPLSTFTFRHWSMSWSGSRPRRFSSWSVNVGMFTARSSGVIQPVTTCFASRFAQAARTLSAGKWIEARPIEQKFCGQPSSSETIRYCLKLSRFDFFCRWNSEVRSRKIPWPIIATRSSMLLSWICGFETSSR